MPSPVLERIRKVVREHRQEAEERDLDVTITAAFEGHQEERTVADCPGREAHVSLMHLTLFGVTVQADQLPPQLRLAVERFIERNGE